MHDNGHGYEASGFTFLALTYVLVTELNLIIAKFARPSGGGVRTVIEVINTGRPQWGGGARVTEKRSRGRCYAQCGDPNLNFVDSYFSTACS